MLDLLFHMPDGYLDRSNAPLLADAKVGEVATLRVEVVGIEEGVPPRPWKVIIRDRSGFGEIAFFGHRPPAVFQKGAVLAVSGKVDGSRGGCSCAIRTGWGRCDGLGELAGAGAGLAADGRAVSGAGAVGDGAGAGGRAGVAGVA